MTVVKFVSKGQDETEVSVPRKVYPNDIRIVGEGFYFWGYTPFDAFVVPIGGKIVIEEEIQQ